MKGKIINFEECICKLLPYLPQYLEEHGINPDKQFSCLNPEHEDSNPSCGILPNSRTNGKWRYSCLGCQHNGNIFQATHDIENKPLSGPTWIDETLLYLTEKYKIPVQLRELTEAEKYEYNVYRAYQDAADLVINPKFGDYTKFNKEAIEKRKWNLEVLTKLGVGTVDLIEFRESMGKLGWSTRFLGEVDLNRREIFSSDSMIFTIKDEYGRPVGFSSRNLNYEEHKAEGKKPRKYVNTSCSNVRINIYDKESRLYNIHLAKQSLPPLYIMEGQGDVVSAYHKGIQNCVAICGSSLTDAQLSLIKSIGCNEIILALDGDKAGKDKVEKLLDDKLSGRKDLNIKVINFSDNEDPDEFFRTHCVKDFKEMHHMDAFEWRLHRFPDGTLSEDICLKMIPLIVNEESYIKQETMCQHLAKETTRSLRFIMAELERLQNLQSAELAQQREAVIEKTFYDLRHHTDDAQSLLIHAADQISDIEKRFDENSLGVNASLSFVQEQRKYEEEKSEDFAGFHLGRSLSGLEKVLNGDWRKDTVIFLGGKENCGKTSLMCQLGYELARDSRNDAIVIYHTTDDSMAQIIPRFVCTMHDTNLELGEVIHPKYWVKRKGALIQSRRNKGYNEIYNLIKDGRLVIRDVTHGDTLAYGESLIRYYKEHYPNRNIIYMMDNFHKFNDFPNLEARHKFTALSNRMKKIANIYHITVISTVEYTKLAPGVKPTNNNIAEARAMQYDGQVIIHLYNDLHDMGPNSTIYHISEKDDQTQLPIIELIFGKNKITSFKSNLMLKFFPSNARFHYIDKSVAKESINNAKADRQFQKEEQKHIVHSLNAGRRNDTTR